MTDAEFAAAVKALTHRLRERDAAIRDGEDYADPEAFAGEFVTALRGYGWRPTPAKTKAPPLHAAPVADKRTRDEELARVRAEMEARRVAAERGTQEATA